MIIIPTVLEKNFTEAEERIRKLKDRSKWIQIDVTDNSFTSGRTFNLELLNRLSFETNKLLWDIHLMVKEPINWIEKCIAIGANRIIGQVEMMSDREEFVFKIKNEGLEAGLAFDTETIIDDIPEETDEILIMGRKSGFEKERLNMDIFEKIKLAKKFGKTIGIDGGVDVENMSLLEKAEVDIVYSGSNYFKLNGND